MPIDPELIDALVAKLSPQQRALFVTGAGLSADSGLPTYRGIGGLYETDLTEDDVPIETALSGPMLAQAPELTWKYLAQIARSVEGAAPNRGHEVIAEFERYFRESWVLTQNIDGFHRLAGSQNLIEIHGNLGRILCTQCDHSARPHSVEELELPPRCDRCAAVMRPDVVLFGEWLPPAAVAQLQQQLQQGFDVVFSIGTSSSFPYIVEPVVAASLQGKLVIEINPVETDVSIYATFPLRAHAAETLDSIWNRIQDSHSHHDE